MRKLLFVTLALVSCPVTAMSAPRSMTPAGPMSVGLRNFRDLASFYSSTTGIPESASNVRAIYNQVVSNLPPTSDVSLFSSSSVRATSALAAAYCIEFVSRESRLAPADRIIHGSMDFTANPKNIPMNVITEVAGNYGQLFWGRAMSPEESAIINQLAESIVEEFPENPISTRRYVASVCTVIATGLESLIINNR